MGKGGLFITRGGEDRLFHIRTSAKEERACCLSLGEERIGCISRTSAQEERTGCLSLEEERIGCFTVVRVLRRKGRAVYHSRRSGMFYSPESADYGGRDDLFSTRGGDNCYYQIIEPPT